VGRAAVASLARRALADALELAVVVATLTCARAGASPPSLEEVRAARAGPGR
jgi:hypothetical protein